MSPAVVRSRTRNSDHRVKSLLIEVREKRGMTQQELERESGVSRRNIGRLERGESVAIDFGTLTRLCDALKCQPGNLLRLEPAAKVD